MPESNRTAWEEELDSLTPEKMRENLERLLAQDLGVTVHAGLGGKIEEGGAHA